MLSDVILDKPEEGENNLPLMDDIFSHYTIEKILFEELGLDKEDVYKLIIKLLGNSI